MGTTRLPDQRSSELSLVMGETGAYSTPPVAVNVLAVESTVAAGTSAGSVSLTTVVPMSETRPRSSPIANVPAQRNPLRSVTMSVQKWPFRVSDNLSQNHKPTMDCFFCIVDCPWTSMYNGGHAADASFSFTVSSNKESLLHSLVV